MSVQQTTKPIDWEKVVRGGGGMHMSCSICYPAGYTGPLESACGEKFFADRPLVRYLSMREAEKKKLCGLCELAMHDRMPCTKCGSIPIFKEDCRHGGGMKK